jgi:hypothetical protein
MNTLLEAECTALSVLVAVIVMVVSLDKASGAV